MIRTVFFDMGNVLVHFSHERMCAQIGALCDLDAPSIKRLLFDTGLQHDFERGLVSEEEIHHKLQETIGRNIEHDALVRAVSDIFWLNESIVPVVKSIRRQGHRMVLLSNTCVTHLNWVQNAYDILSHFDHLVTSCEAGAMKPEPQIFEAALAAAHCAPPECFYTDDIAEYVMAARTHGIDAEVYVDTPSLIEHLEARGIRVERTG